MSGRPKLSKQYRRIALILKHQGQRFSNTTDRNQAIKLYLQRNQSTPFITPSQASNEIPILNNSNKEIDEKEKAENMDDFLQISPAEIAFRAKEIQNTWSEDEKLRRSGIQSHEVETKIVSARSLKPS